MQPYPPWGQPQTNLPQIPLQFTRGDSITWLDGPFADAMGNVLSPVNFSFAYTVSGPVAPVTITGTPSGQAWSVALTAAVSATLLPGVYSWAATVTGTAIQVTVGTGQLKVLQNLALGTSTFDARTKMQKALDDAETAIAAYAATGRFMKRYMIGQRSMEFSDPKELQNYADWLRARVQHEREATDGGKSRRLLTRFDRAH